MLLATRERPGLGFEMTAGAGSMISSLFSTAGGVFTSYFETSAAKTMQKRELATLVQRDTIEAQRQLDLLVAQAEGVQEEIRQRALAAALASEAGARSTERTGSYYLAGGAMAASVVVGLTLLYLMARR